MNEINYVEMFASYDTALAEMLSVEQAIREAFRKKKTVDIMNLALKEGGYQT